MRKLKAHLFAKRQKDATHAAKTKLLMMLCPRTHLDLDKQSAAMISMPNDVSIRHTTSEKEQLRSAADLYWTLEFSQRWSASRKRLLLE